MKRLLIVFICLIVISASALFVGCGNNPTPNTPPNIDLENNQDGTEPEDSIEPENPEPSPEEPSTPSTPETPPEEDPENDGGDLTPENPSNPNPPTDEEDGSENNPTTPPSNDNDDTENNEPTIPEDPEPIPEPEPDPDPEPEPEPIITFDFTIYNSKENVIYNLENDQIFVKLTENTNDNIVHFKCLIYVDDILSSNQTLNYTLTNADKLANSNPQNSSNFYFKFNTIGTYVLTLSNADNTHTKTISIIVE